MSASQTGMQRNGTVLAAYAEQLSEPLSGVTPLDYYRQPLAAPLDLHLDELVERYMALEMAERTTLRGLLPDRTLSLLGIYAHRAATRALNIEDARLLLKGLVAWSVANEGAPTGRRPEVSLAVFHHCARILDLAPADLFAQVADYADGDLAALLTTFGNRADVTLKQYGWDTRHTPEGIQFKYGWK